MVENRASLIPQKRIKNFPIDNLHWRIDWIGSIFYSIDDEPKVRVYLSRLLPNTSHEKVLNNTSLFGSKDTGYDHRMVDIKIGFIQLLKIGSVWVNGIQQLSYRATEEAFEVEITNLAIVPLSKSGATNLNDGHGWEEILSNYQYRIPEESARKGSWVAVVFDHPKYKRVVIPSSVIFQTCYVTSPKAASHIIFGQLDKLIDLDESGFLSEKSNVFRVCIHKDYRNTEGVLLANLASGRVAKRNLDILRRNIVIKSNIADGAKDGVALKVNFPFNNEIKLRVLGKVIPYKSNPNEPNETREIGFFVSEILSLQAPFEFDSILPVRKNDGKKGLVKAEELLNAFGGVRARKLDEQDQTLLTEEDVSTFLDATQINAISIVDINQITILDNDKEFQQYQSMPFHSIAGSGEANDHSASTGDKKQLKNGASETNIALAPVKLDEFFEVIDWLASSGLKINMLEVGHSTRGQKGIVNYFPQVIKGCYSWHLTVDKSRARAFIIAELYIAGQYFYLIDVEAKKTGVLSIALIYNADRLPITTQSFYSFMKEVARENGWSVLKKIAGYEKNWIFRAVDHNRKGDSHKVANNILKLIN